MEGCGVLQAVSRQVLTAGPGIAVRAVCGGFVVDQVIYDEFFFQYVGFHLSVLVLLTYVVRQKHMFLK